MSISSIPRVSRDGSYSVAALLEDDTAEDDRMRVDVATARAWAAANGVEPEDGKLHVGRVNARRAAMKLPLFTVVRVLQPVVVQAVDA